MKSIPNSQRKLRTTFLTCNLLWIGVFLSAVINRAYPSVGHDYAYFVSRLFDTYLHYRINGLSVQWYTPSFGGGLPAYANPQHMQFSIPQVLTAFLDPWTASLTAVILMAVTGIIFFYSFALHILKLDWRASLLGALFFVLTGFYIGHMISGQLGFLGFPLLAGILLLLFQQELPDLLTGALIGVMTASLVYAAGFYTLIIFALSCAITLPMLYLVRSDIFFFRSLALRAGLAGLFFGLISISKFYAIYTFMRYFPREIGFEYDSEYVNSVLLPAAFFVAQLLGTTTLAPLMTLGGQDVNSLNLILSNLSGYRYSGLWETDNGISPILLGIFLTAAFQHLRSRVRIRLTGMSRDKILAVMALGFAIWFTLEYSLAKGWLYALASELPVLKSLHINFRFTAAFYFPLALAGAIIVQRWFVTAQPRRAWVLFLMLNLLTLISPLAYFLYTEDVHYRILDVREIQAAYAQSRNGKTFTITAVANEQVRDWDALPRSETSLRPYEPVFGYGIPFFAARIQPGPVSEIRAGFFNLTNPASLTFPEANGGSVFSLFASTDRERFEKFVERRQPDWNTPALQIALNAVSTATVLVVFSIICAHVLQRWRKPI